MSGAFQGFVDDTFKPIFFRVNSQKQCKDPEHKKSRKAHIAKAGITYSSCDIMKKTRKKRKRNRIKAVKLMLSNHS